MIEVKLLLSVNRKPYMPRRLAKQQPFSDLEWLFHIIRIARYSPGVTVPTVTQHSPFFPPVATALAFDIFVTNTHVAMVRLSWPG